MNFLSKINFDLYTEGIELLDGDPKEAINVLNKRIEENPNESILWYLIGKAYQNIDEKLKALESYEKAIELDPENYMSWNSKGKLIIGNPKEAIKCFDASLELNEDANIWYLRGLCTQSIEDHKESVYCFNKALEIEMVNPTPVNQDWYYDAWNYKGVSLFRLNEYEEAIVSFDQAIEIDPNAEEAWLWKVKSLSLLGKEAEAEKCLAKSNKLVGIEPELKENNEINEENIKSQIANINSEINNLKKKCDDKFFEAGEIAYSECISSNYEMPSDVKIKFDDILAFDTLINKTNADIENEKNREKKTGFLAKLGGAVSSVAKQGKHKVDLYNYGKNKKSTTKDFGKILWESYKKEGYIINSISNIWQDVKEIDQNINAKENEIENQRNLLNKLKAEKLFDLGVNAEDPDKKLEYFSKALDINPEVAVWWIIKGGTLNDLCRYNEAMTCCDKALEIDPESGSAWNYKGVSLKNLEKYMDALACFDKALEIDPDYENAKINREMLNKELIA